MVAASGAPGERRVACRPAAIACGQVLSAQQLKDRLLQEIDLDELEEGLDPEDRQFLGFDDALMHWINMDKSCPSTRTIVPATFQLQAGFL